MYKSTSAIMSRSKLYLISTKLTRLLGIRSPIVLPPMAGAAGGELAGQVSLAGGFGFLSASYGTTPDQFKHQLSLARSALPIETPHLPVGVGYLAWQLEQPKSTLIDLLPIALDHNVQAIWFAFGENIGHWIQLVRDHDERMRKKQKTLVFVQISTVKEALIATNEWKVDCIVAQSVESGGHGAGYALPLLNLVPLILAALPADSPPVLAAGGLANGGHVASVLTLGAAGAVLGTRFLLAEESLYSEAQRKALVSATSELSVRSMAWDHARGTLGWPAGVDGRGLRNSEYRWSNFQDNHNDVNEEIVDGFENGTPVENLKESLQEGIENQDTDAMIVWAGTGIGQMDKIQSAGSIMEEVHRECLSHLQTAAAYLNS